MNQVTPESEHIVHKDLWVEEAARRLKQQNKAEVEAAMDTSFDQVKGIIAYGYGILVLLMLTWLLWWLKNYLKIDLFPNKDFDFIDDSEKLLD